MKQTKHILLTIATLLCSLAASAQDFVVNGIYYYITSSTNKTVLVTFQGYSSSNYDEYKGSVVIPSRVSYGGSEYRVTSIGDEAFSYCSSLTAITIPEGVTSIGDYAFDGCTSLTAINIPEGVTSIGSDAFSYCRSLTSITIPEGVTSIGESAFYKCSSLTSINIPESVTSIEGEVFYGCSSLTSIVVAEGNEVYDSRNGCNAIIETNSNTLIQGCATTIIPEGVTSIGNYAFSGCSSLTSITLPESVTSIGDEAFYNCSSLTTITIPEDVTSIGDYAFSYCSSLTSITIPESVTSIGSDAFSYCRSLTSITIPESVTSIGDDAFDRCSSLYKVINCSNLSLSAGSSDYGYVAYYAKVVYRGSELTTVGDFQFYTYSGIHSLVNYIGDDTEIVLPDSYNGENYKIGDYAFLSCSSLTSITIPESVTSIGNYAFYGCI